MTIFAITFKFEKTIILLIYNSVLTHVSLAYEIPLPNKNGDDYALKRVTYMSKIAQGDLNQKECNEMINDLEEIVENIMKIKPEKKDKGNKLKLRKLPNATKMINTKDEISGQQSKEIPQLFPGQENEFPNWQIPLGNSQACQVLEGNARMGPILPR